MTQPLGKAAAKLLSRFARSISQAEASAAAGPSSAPVIAATQAGRHFSALPEPIEGGAFSLMLLDHSAVEACS